MGHREDGGDDDLGRLDGPGRLGGRGLAESRGGALTGGVDLGPGDALAGHRSGGGGRRRGGHGGTHLARAGGGALGLGVPGLARRLDPDGRALRRGPPDPAAQRDLGGLGQGCHPAPGARLPHVADLRLEQLGEPLALDHGRVDSQVTTPGGTR
ncbi:hypothetical protein [Streptosporangium vulgare]|uniref:hypothetical protein n=1 Tax=Streptosporangium vulgare TaxID=46190 RepID=UPI0031D498D4